VGLIAHDQRAVDELGCLASFGTGLYGCFGAWADTLFELVDALAGSAGRIRSVAELMFAPVARRGWGSLYQALEHGEIDVDRARDLMVSYVRRDWPLMFAIDGSKYPRRDTRYVDDVGLQYAAEHDRAGGAPVVPGWMMQWVAQVGGASPSAGSTSSWTLPVDVRRLATRDNANELAADQIADLVGRLGAAGFGGVPLFLLDAGYCHPSGHTQVWWLWWAGPGHTFDLDTLAAAYQHRFGIEHTFRFTKQDMFWTGHTPLDPDQAERWSWLVLVAYAQLHLARPLAVDQRLPWEKRCPPDQLSPRRVRRVFRQVTASMPSPARAPKPSRPGTGRPPGSKNKRTRDRKPVIKKGRPTNTGHARGRSPRARSPP